METGADIVTFWPRWADDAGAMLRINALVRSRCARCGTLLRVELEDVVARHGPVYFAGRSAGPLPDGRLRRLHFLSCLADLRAGLADNAARPSLIADLGAIAPARTALG